MKIKICGLHPVRDVQFCIDLGVDFLGFVFYEKSPRNIDLKEINKLEGCFFSRMTGSGSACYGLFDDENSSKVALKRLRKKYPKFWFSIAKTI